ncbi:hypothetical protein ES703_34078 [subsurface metagenome]
MLLNDEEIRNCRTVDEVAKKQLKKVVEYVNEIMEYYQCNGACDRNYHITNDRKWQALLEELELGVIYD